MARVFGTTDWVTSSVLGDPLPGPTPPVGAPPTLPPPPVVTPPDVDRNCRLLGPFALILQGFMGLLVVASLLYKRHREHPRRPWRIWILDITKQMAGQAFVHLLNIGLSDVLATHGKRSPCSLLFLAVVMDTTIGVFIIYVTMNLLTHLFTEVWGFDGFVSGRYRPVGVRGRPKVEFWLKQTGTYLFAVLVMKLIVTALFYVFPVLVFFSTWLINLFGPGRAQIVFVLAIVPLTMNVIQFWLIDSLLRHDPETSRYSKLNASAGGESDGDEDHSSDEERSETDRLERSMGQAGPSAPRRPESSEGTPRSGTPSRPSSRTGSVGVGEGYGSTLKSPPLRPRPTSHHSSQRSSLDELRLEAASILSGDGKPSSMRGSSERASRRSAEARRVTFLAAQGASDETAL